MPSASATCAGGREHAGEHLGVAGLEDGGVVDVPTRHHQDVHGRLGVEVAEGHGVLGAVHDLGGDLARDDAAEQAVRGVAHRPPVRLLQALGAGRASALEPFTSG